MGPAATKGGVWGQMGKRDQTKQTRKRWGEISRGVKKGTNKIKECTGEESREKGGDRCKKQGVGWVWKKQTANPTIQQKKKKKKRRAAVCLLGKGSNIGLVPKQKSSPKKSTK